MPGPKGEPISIEEWQRLAELPNAHLRDADESGLVYMVVRVGFVNANADKARAAGITFPIAAEVPAGTLPLPTVTIRSAEGERLYRLPGDLNDWAISVVALANDGQNLFPCEVEFGTPSGRPFAEFVLAESRTN